MSARYRGTVSRRSADFFEEAYAGTPPWEIGRPQPVFVRLEDEGRIAVSVLDAGCGTGENALFLSDRGHEVLCFDTARTAIARATEKGQQRRLAARFVVHDALALDGLGRPFDTAIDSGLLHTFSDADRAAYIRALAAAVRPGGAAFVMCFSEHEPGAWGPRRVTRDELMDAFADGWRIRSIHAERFATTLSDDGAQAWLAEVERSS
ncbi:class I SAM-dependent methyltransferase [soil metagenome]